MHKNLKQFIRPWDRESVKHDHIFGIIMGGSLDKSSSSIAFAVLQHEAHKKMDEGEIAFREDQETDQKIAEAVTQYLLLRKKYGNQPVQLFKYTTESFRSSRAASEGMTLDQHNAMVDRISNALEKADASVKVNIRVLQEG